MDSPELEPAAGTAGNAADGAAFALEVRAIVASGLRRMSATITRIQYKFIQL